MKTQSEPDKYQAIFTWWEKLKLNTGQRARLSRLQDPLDACFQPAFYDLEQIFKEHGISDYQKKKACVLACLLASVRESNNLPVAQSLAGTGGQAPFSPLRLRRLLSHEDLSDLFPSMYRAIKILKGNVNVKDLAHAIVHWNARTRRTWASQYYNADQEIASEKE